MDATLPGPRERHEIRHDQAGSQFFTEVDGQRALLDYRLADGVLAITHTGVPEAIGGRGIAGALVRAAFEYAQANGLKVAPRCSYAASWMQRHPEFADLAA